MTRTTFNMDQVTEMRTALEAAPKSTSKLSKADVIRQLAPTLRQLRDEKDYTLEALVELLKAKGLEVKVSTLQSALKRKGAQRKAGKGAPMGASTTPAAAVHPPSVKPGAVATTSKSAKAA